MEHNATIDILAIVLHISVKENFSILNLIDTGYFSQHLTVYYDLPGGLKKYDVVGVT